MTSAGRTARACGGGVNTMNEEQEDELFEKTKMGWQFRDLYIELDHEVA